MRHAPAILLLPLGLLACDGFRVERECTDGRQPIAVDLRFDGVDNDCDGLVDEGEADNRLHCGGDGQQCLLTPGAVDVACVDGMCVPVGEMSVVTETCGECLDGLDNDGNGRVDDGPYCEALIASVASPDCHGRTGTTTDCPMAVTSMGSDGPIDEHPEHSVGWTYDFLADRHEVTRGQFLEYLHAQGACEEGQADRRCTVSAEMARLPVESVTWCEAHDYCAWAGKRLLTEAEYERLAGVHKWDGLPRQVLTQDRTATSSLTMCPGEAVGMHDCATRANGDTSCTSMCGRNSNAPVNADCGFADLGPLPVDVALGAVFPGGAVDATTGRLRYQRLAHVLGNVIEFVFDRQQPYPEAGGLRVDPVVGDELLADVGGETSRRIGRGGGYRDPEDSTRPANRNAFTASTAPPTFGFRCGRTFAGAQTGALEHEVPYPTRARDGARRMARDYEVCAVERNVGSPLEAGARVVTTSCAEPLASATGVSGAIEEVVSETLSAVRPPFALAIELTADGTARLGAAISVDGRWHWVEGMSRASVEIPRWGDCEVDGCTIQQPQWQMPVETGADDFVSFELLKASFVENSSDACDIRFEGPSDEPILRLEVKALRDSRLSLTGENQAIDYLCVVTPMTCTEEEADLGISCLDCTGWLATFDLRFETVVID